MSVTEERKLMSDELIAMKVYQLAALQQQMADQKALYDLMAGQLNKLKQTYKKIEEELKDEQQFQFSQHGVASIHPALSVRKRTVRDFSKTNIMDVPEKDRVKYLVINEKMMGDVLDMLIEQEGVEKILSVNTKELGKLAEKKIPSWSKHDDSTVRNPSLKSKLGEFLHNPLAKE